MRQTLIDRWDVRQTLIDGDGDDADQIPEQVAEWRTRVAAERAAVAAQVEDWRTHLAAERAAVAAVWRDGDELWEWRNECWAPKLELTDSIGEIGIAVLRAGCVIAAWKTGSWA